MRTKKELKTNMFCKVCGTVLDSNSECVNCEKKQSGTQSNSDRQTVIESKVTG